MVPLLTIEAVAPYLEKHCTGPVRGRGEVRLSRWRRTKGAGSMACDQLHIIRLLSSTRAAWRTLFIRALRYVSGSANSPSAQREWMLPTATKGSRRELAAQLVSNRHIWPNVFPGVYRPVNAPRGKLHAPHVLLNLPSGSRGPAWSSILFN